MTEEHGVPDHRCGFELEPDDEDIDSEDDLNEWRERIGAVCCWRPTWYSKQCVWHFEVVNKPLKELKAARADGPERLDGAFLAGVEADDKLSFRGCDLRAAVFSNGDFSNAEFQNAILLGAEFHDTSLSGTKFHNAILQEAEFHNASLWNARFDNADLFHAEFHDSALGQALFHEAFLRRAQFHDAYLRRAVFHNATLHGAEFHNAYLHLTKFNDALLHYAEFHDAYLYYAQFLNANLTNAKFYGANLSRANCTNVDAIDTNFTNAILHDTILARADCRGAIFTSALLYETVFEDTRINSQTTFYAPEETFYDSITSRPAVVYEENPAISANSSEDTRRHRPHITEWKNLPEGTHRLKAAEWVYRRLEKLHDENALSEDAREFHISKEEVRRKYQCESGEYARCAVSTLQWHVTGHGESIPRIFRAAAVLILGSGILYPFGGFESSSTGRVYRIPLTNLHQIISLDGAATILQGIYFSVITFTTIGYGDLYPTGAWSKVLVGFESLSGAILIALFVFVLGRRVAR